jgi:hypothetical protein
MRSTLRKCGASTRTGRLGNRRIKPQLGAFSIPGRFWERPQQSKIAAVVVAALSVAAALQLIGKAQAYDVVDVATPPPPPTGPWGFGRPMNLRIEGGVGYNNGGTDTTVSSPGIGSVSTNLFGGGGIAAEAAIWSDFILLPSISIGAQYLHFDHAASITASSGAGSIFGLTSASGNLNLTPMP